jgi:hypothetical protein
MPNKALSTPQPLLVKRNAVTTVAVALGTKLVGELATLGEKFCPSCGPGYQSGR